MFSARIEADSVSPDGVRLTTLVVTMPRFILAEFNTHRAFSRNAASSRAIPVEKRIAAIEADPFVPEVFGSNRKGMQAGDPLPDRMAQAARDQWLSAAAEAVNRARYLADAGVHKQLANRLLEPFAWTTVVVTATDWANFFALRCHPDAQPEMQKVATLMRDAMEASEPGWVGGRGDRHPWHLPFVYGDDWCAMDVGFLSMDELKLVSVGRCARVSYKTHDGKEDHAADIALARRLMETRPMHASPFEHVATPAPGRWANFRGWKQLRLDLPGNVVEEAP